MLGLGPVCCSPALCWMLGCDQRGCTERFGGLHSLNPTLQGARLGAGGGWDPHPRVLLQHRDGGDTEEPGWEPGNGFPVALLGGSARYPPGASSALSHRPRLCPGAPGRGCSGLHPIPSAGCAFLHSCRGAGARRGPVPPLPRDPSTRQTHPSWDSPLCWTGGEMGKTPSAAFPTWQQPQEQQVAEDAWTPKGCLAQSSFASHCAQATRFVPCRGAFGMQPLRSAAAGMPAEPTDGGWRWEPEG